jgi:glucose-6-phosphate 1-dehydrogenase
VEFAQQGGEGPTPYEVLFHAALTGDAEFFTHQDTVEEALRVVQPLLDDMPRLHSYPKGGWGPAAARELPESHGGWRPLWTE